MQCKYNDTQRLFSLCWLSNEANSILDTEEHLQRTMETRLQTAFGNAEMQKLIGTWTVVWGPVVLVSPRENKSTLTNGMYVARNHDGSQYVIAVTSTNTTSLYDWFVEDGAVFDTTDWVPSRATPLDPRISEGTSIGLKNLLSMKTDKHAIGSARNEELSLREFMGAQMRTVQKRVEWTVTGYSLGGALAPVMALALDDIRSEWDPARYATLTCAAFAGATPGNGDFARYYGEQMGSVTTRVWNALDVVPHAWDYNMLVAVPSLYAPVQNSGVLAALMVDLAKADGLASLFDSETPYRQLLPQTPGLPGQVSLPLCRLSDHQAFSMVVKTAMDRVVEIALAHIHGLPGFVKAGIENMINSAYDWIDAHTTAIDDLIAQTIAELDKIGKHHHIEWIGRVLRLVLRVAEQFVAFFDQLGYQHTTAYLQLLEVERMHAVLGEILDIEGDRLKHQEQQMQAVLERLKSLITVDFLHRHGHALPA